LTGVGATGGRVFKERKNVKGGLGGAHGVGGLTREGVGYREHHRLINKKKKI